jgi:hypothetical protein
MKKTKRPSSEEEVKTLQREDWNFSEVPDGELIGCCYWEYARESAFIRDTLHRYREWFAEGGKRDKASDELFARTDRIQSAGRGAEMLLRGCAFKAGTVWQSTDPERENYRHPEAPPITGSFPDPWQTLSQGERAYRSRLAKYGEGIFPPPVERGDFHEAEDIAKHCRSKWDKVLSAFHELQRQNPGKSEVQLRADGKLEPYEEIPPSLFWESGREVTVLRIAWQSYTNDELAGAFRRWVKAHRPKQIPVPSNRGRKPGDLRAHLTRLAVMRLLSRFKTSEILNPRGRALHAVFDSLQFAALKWHDATKWHDARREAGQFFGRLFPFLPAGEKPRSWDRRPPGK